jgi:hypothetical protein
MSLLNRSSLENVEIWGIHLCFDGFDHDELLHADVVARPNNSCLYNSPSNFGTCIFDDRYAHDYRVYRCLQHARYCAWRLLQGHSK